VKRAATRVGSRLWKSSGTLREAVGSLGGVRVALSQLNQTVGDLLGNTDRMRAGLERAEIAGADVVVFPELAVTGYPPEDLVLKPQFVRDNMHALAGFAAATAGKRCRAVAGFVEARDSRLYNAVALCGDGEVLAVYRKRLLPNYAVFDEQRYFEPGPAEVGGVTAGVVMLGSVKTGLTICEDIWTDNGPVQDQARAHARVMLNVNGSPFHSGKHEEREQMLADRARQVRTPIVYVNQVGGQDELVFDGSSVVLDSRGEVACRLRAFDEDFEVVDIDTDNGSVASSRIEPHTDGIDRVHSALVIGTRDYVRKNGFTDVVIGLSGGIDSSIVAAIAVDALGADHVHGVAMPSRYSSRGSLDDAAALAANLGIDHRVISIEPSFSAYLSMLEPSFSGRDPDLTEENLQSRCRGTTLMALSNKFGWMVLTTGNKSELAVGYFTIYGDSAGGYSVIKDVFKTQVFELSRRVNERAGREIIPQSVLDKPPSAELRPDQRDDQSLPPYDELDAILRLYVDGDMTVPEIIAAGHAEETVRRISRLVDVNEYKRRQCAPGVRLSQKAFGKDRRMPITSGYR
jgi:NAD+ synthase (glutamine-hydrolysing)